MRILHYAVPPYADGKSIKWLLKNELQISSTLVKSLKWHEGAIRLNERPVRIDAPAHTGDTIAVTLLERAVRKSDVLPLDVPLDIVYEDEDLLVLNKSGDLAMHPKSTDPAAPHLAGALVAYLGEGSIPHFVSRLDKGTSGLLIAAKSGYVHELMRRALHTQALYREYAAIVIGQIAPPSGEISAPIAREPGSIIKRCCTSDGQPSSTHYETISVHGELSLMRLVPHTGRTHQLRVHMAHLGHPLLGDWLYGQESEQIARPALHSCALHFVHPLSGKQLDFSLPLPPDMAQCLR